jgi:hypothetical protein
MEGKAILNVLHDIEPDIKHSISLAADNQSSLIMANSPTFSRRTRHVELKWHYIRERIEKGDIQMMKICSEINPTDLFTNHSQNKDSACGLTKLVYHQIDNHISAVPKRFWKMLLEEVVLEYEV